MNVEKLPADETEVFQYIQDLNAKIIEVGHTPKQLFNSLTGCNS